MRRRHQPGTHPASTGLCIASAVGCRDVTRSGRYAPGVWIFLRPCLLRAFALPAPLRSDPPCSVSTLAASRLCCLLLLRP